MSHVKFTGCISPCFVCTLVLKIKISRGTCCSPKIQTKWFKKKKSLTRLPGNSLYFTVVSMQVTVCSFFLSHLNPTTQGAENKSFTFPVFVFLITVSSLYV